jgi:hypothetical protein
VKPPDALARATALVSARPNPLRPANEINPAVGLELAEILTRAMAQNPDERYGSATEFREALRQIGRVSEADVECVVYHSEIDSTVVETGETTIVRSVRLAPTGRLGSHAIAAMFVILLTAFGVFCSYYPWKMPTTTVQQSTYTNAQSALPASSAGELRRNDSKRQKQKRRDQLHVMTMFP